MYKMFFNSMPAMMAASMRSCYMVFKNTVKWNINCRAIYTNKFIFKNEESELSKVSDKTDYTDKLLKKMSVNTKVPTFRQGLSSVNSAQMSKPQDARNNKTKIDKRTVITVDKCETEVLKNLNISFSKAYETLKYYDEANRYPSRKTYLKMLVTALSNLNFEGMTTIINKINLVYPKEFEWEMGYEHYVAEYNWKMGNYNEARKIFEKLFSKYPQRKKKLSDMITFMARKIINHEPGEEVQVLVEFVGLLVKKYSTHQPAANVWLLLFLSKKGTYNILSTTLLNINPQKMGSFLTNKIDSIIKFAEESCQIECIQRLIECVLFLTLKEEYTKVFSSLLELQCLSLDKNGAKETFIYCSKEGIALKGTALKQYSTLLSIDNPKKELFDPKIQKDYHSNKFRIKF